MLDIYIAVLKHDTDTVEKEGYFKRCVMFLGNYEMLRVNGLNSLKLFMEIIYPLIDQLF